MTKREYRRFTKEFKLEAIRLAEESEKPVTQVARELGLRVNQIYKWKRGNKGVSTVIQANCRIGDRPRLFQLRSVNRGLSR